jgi:hypothetical protein
MACVGAHLGAHTPGKLRATPAPARLAHKAVIGMPRESFRQENPQIRRKSEKK